MSIKLISKHRTCLMALAMIWIGLYHIYYGSDIRVIDFFVYRQGYFGVDIFMFLSGFGIFQSLSKDSNYKHFIIKRIKKILPYCIPIYIVSSIIKKESVLLCVVDCLGLSIFFRNSIVNWFTSLILILYFITPLYKRIFDRKPIICSAISIILIFIVCILKNSFDVTYILFRVALYILGFYFGYLYNENKDISKGLYTFIIVLAFMGFLLIYLLNHYYRNDITYIYPSILVTPGIVLIMSYLIEKISFVQRPLNYLGKYTFQFYLFHKTILDYMTNNLYSALYKPGVHFDFVFNHSTIIIAFLIGLVYKKIIDALLNLINGKIGVSHVN